MKNLIVVLVLFVAACSNGVEPVADNQPAEQVETATESNETIDGLQLNNGNKWIADDNTRKNVGVLADAINDPANAREENREQLTTRLQSGVDSLIFQCQMQGADHDALHVWLEQFLVDLDELKEAEAGEFQKTYELIKSDVNRFYEYFE